MTNTISGFMPQTQPTAQVKSGFAATSENTKSVTTAEEPVKISLREEINEKGFRNYVEEIHKKKLEELREKILDSMGLSEEDLKNMSGEQRSQIEELISREITARMQAAMEIKGNEPNEEGEQNSFKDIASSYQLSADGQNVSNKEREEKSKPMFVSLFT